MGAEEAEGRAVREIGRVDPAVPQRTAGGPCVLDGGEVGGYPRAAEDIRDQDVEGSGRGPFQQAPGVRAVHGDAAVGGDRQLFGDQFEEPEIGLGDVLAGARPGRGGVAGQGERTAAEVEYVQRCARCRRAVDDMGEPSRVLELQVFRCVEVDVGLGRAVDGEQPGPVPVHVGEESGGALVHVPDDGYRVVHSPIVGCRISCSGPRRRLRCVPPTDGARRGPPLPGCSGRGGCGRMPSSRPRPG